MNYVGEVLKLGKKLILGTLCLPDLLQSTYDSKIGIVETHSK